MRSAKREKKKSGLSQRPSGYRVAPVAVPEICCLLCAAPDFDRCHSSPSLTLPQAVVGLVPQRATLAGLMTRRSRFKLQNKKITAIQKDDCYFLVAGAGFEPTTFGL